jgi:p-hydroxybenzoate 3-monooxygenase
MSIGDGGFAAQFGRGPKASRYYLQGPTGDDISAWPDDRIWDELRLRLGEPDHASAPITDKRIVEMRSVVFEPMSYGRLYLVGDAAHIFTPMGGKGMNQALYDAGVLARALADHVFEGDQSGLAGYSATSLRRMWKYQEYSRWLTEMMHDAGDERTSGPFRRQMARARLDGMLHSPAATRFFAAYQIGVM